MRSAKKRDRKKWLEFGMLGTLAAIESLIFFLYELPFEPYAYLLVLTAAVFGVRRMLDTVRERKKQERLFAMKKEAQSYLDPTHFPQADDRLERDYQELGQILERRCRKAEEEKREKLDDAARYYTRWSHQIKTPIAGMRLLLEEEPLDRSALERELFHTEQYVETALQYQRLGGSSRDLVIRRYTADVLVKQALKKTKVLFIQKKIIPVLGKLDAEILTDEKWMVFVLEQLLTNAVKYTRSGGKVSIYLDEKKENVLVVEDDGIGISQEDLPRIFEWGYTGYNGRLEKHSTGIGLALCKQTLDMLGHRIWVESEPGKGTKIYISEK